jgi:hypothetical protein
MHFYLYSTANQFRAEKIKIHKTFIKPVAIYGAVPWTMNIDIAKWLAIFERKVLRRMFGGIKVNENWRKQYYIELM